MFRDVSLLRIVSLVLGLAFGFVDITTPCAGLPTRQGYLFWDRIHPTTLAHAHLAEAALRELRGKATLPSGDTPPPAPR